MKKYDVVRKPMDYFTGQSPDKCSYAFFPGYGLSGYEPDIIVKMFDSLLFQRPDTGIFIYGYAADDPDLVKHWEELGKPTMLLTCPRLMDKFQKDYPDIPVDSAYEVLIDLGISGGCNKEEYILHRPDDVSEEFLEPVKALAEDMGVTFVEEAPGIPYITSSMADRNKLKREGKDAAHILELIYGMGDSNTHLIHEDHDHDDCDGNCATCSLAEGCEMEAGGQKVDIEWEVKAEPSPLPTDEQVEVNRAELLEALNALFWTPKA